MNHNAHDPEDPRETSPHEEPRYVAAPPIEGVFAKYLREHRLLNSLLVSLFTVTLCLVLAWGLIVYVTPDASGAADFADAQPSASLKDKRKEQLKRDLMKRQKSPSITMTFRPKAPSDVPVPDSSPIDVKDLSPAITPSAPSMEDLGDFAPPVDPGAFDAHLPKTMKQRCDPKARMEKLRSGNGLPVTEQAIVRGLTWLKNTQAEDGSWGGDAKGADGKPAPQDKNAMTGMALLCFLGHCELQDSPEFGDTVKKAIDFLTSTPPDKTSGKFSYSHPIRAYALCEAYTMTKIRKLEAYAKEAAETIVKGQNANGGWAYGYGKGEAAHVDLSVTGWNVQALKAAALTGISIDGLDEAMDKAVAYVKRCQDDTGRFRYLETRHGGQSAQGSLTGAGVLCLQIWKEAKSDEARKGLDWIIANQTDDWTRVNVYEWYYHAQACFQATGSNNLKYWRSWNKKFQQIVCAAQEADGHWKHGSHFHGDTDVYRTTMAILMLEVYYRYMPTGKTG